MKLAVNWSPEAAALLDEGKIEFDMYKCPDWENLIADAQRQRPSYIHFPLRIGSGQRPEWDFEVIQRWLDSTSTLFVNCHIAPKHDVFDEKISMRALTAQLVEEVQTLVDQFGAERVIIENCPFMERHEHKYLRQSREPRLFHDIIAATGCGFLLDMSHAYLTSQYWGRDFADYVGELPVKHIKELHTTGIGIWSNGNYGDHMPFTEPDWTRLAFCMEQIKIGQWQVPQVVAFEYGGSGFLKDLCGSDKNRIEEQVPRLYEQVQLVQQATA